MYNNECCSFPTLLDVTAKTRILELMQYKDSSLLLFFLLKFKKTFLLFSIIYRMKLGFTKRIHVMKHNYCKILSNYSLKSGVGGTGGDVVPSEIDVENMFLSICEKKTSIQYWSTKR